MTAEVGVQVVRQYADAIADHDLNGVEALLAPGAVLAVAGWHQPLEGSAAVRKFLAIWLWLYPDLRSRVVRLETEEGGVRLERELSGVHEEDIPPMPAHGFAGIVAAGQRMQCREVETLWVEAGRIQRIRLRSGLVTRHPSVESLFNQALPGAALKGFDGRRIPGFLRDRFRPRRLAGGMGKPGGDSGSSDPGDLSGA